jgi:hypothetical protein
MYYADKFKRTGKTEDEKADRAGGEDGEIEESCQA